MVCHALGAGFVGLIHVDALHRPAEGGRGVGSVGGVSRGGWGRAADRVVEDEDLRGAGAVWGEIRRSGRFFLSSL